MRGNPASPHAAPARVRFGDFNVDCVSRADLTRLALADCTHPVGRPRLVFDVNGHALSLARTNLGYRKSVAEADIVHADGGFLVTLSRLGNRDSIPERSATTDVIHDLAAAFEKTSFSFFLLGGEERVNRECSEILHRNYPGLAIAGRQNGFFSREEEREVVEKINAAAPDILWVGLGKPKEQEFCIRWRDELKARWLITCGGCFNYISGDYGRAPIWMQESNLEWLFRLAENPRKLFWRYAVTSPHALWIAAIDTIGSKFGVSR